jgi:DnaJ-domain-containing protein 1
MENNGVSSEERTRLRRREAELLQRIERLKKAMNETNELNTLALKGKLFKEAQEELKRVQERLAGAGTSENPD